MKILGSNTFFIVLSLILLLLKLWLVSAHYLMATSTPHDDLLFVSQAHEILGGNWLGPFNQLTLIKGQFYPLFIASSYYLNIPLLISQQLLYALASSLAILALTPLVKQKWLLFLLFALLLLNPFSYNYPAVGRVLRLGIYMSLGLMVFSCFLGLCIQGRQSWQKALIWALGAGISLSAFWHTREESIWIAPSLLLLLIPAFYQLRGQPRLHRFLHAFLYVLPFLMVMLANHQLAETNRKHYGIPATIELETPQFKAAYGGLLRIKSDRWRQYYPVVADVRTKAYEVSPAFREVQAFLDGPIGEKWQDLCGCDDIPAAFFIWAFRDSVAAAGYYKNGLDTLKFYQRIGNEIDQACGDGRLDCRPRVTSLVPTWHREYNASFPATFLSVLQQIIGFKNFSADTDDYISQGRRGIMFMYEVVTREKLLPSHRDTLENSPEFNRHLDKEKTRILNDIGAAYQAFVPPLFFLTLVIFVFISGRSAVQRTLSLLTVSAGASLVGILSIAFILTLLSITSYTEIARAMHSAYPMVLLFIASVILDVATRLFSRLNKQDQTEIFE